MEKLYTVSKNKTRSRLWLRSWTPYCQIQTEIEESGETTRSFRYDLNQIPYDYTLEVRNRFKGLISYLSILKPKSSYKKNRKHIYLNSIIFSWFLQLIFVVSLKVMADFVSSPSKCQRWNTNLPYLVNAKLIYFIYFCMIMICGNEFPWLFLLFF